MLALVFVFVFAFVFVFVFVLVFTFMFVFVLVFVLVFQVLLDSTETGPGLVWDPALRHAHMINHFEYDGDTLGGEYWRDRGQGTPTGEPTLACFYKFYTSASNRLHGFVHQRATSHEVQDR